MSFALFKSTIDSLPNLIASTKAGDSSAFGKIYDKFVDQIFRFVFYKVGSQTVAEDLTQNTFLKALEKIAQFRTNTNFQAWLYTIARNEVVDFYRTRKKTVELSSVSELIFEDHINDITIKDEVEKAYQALKNLSSEEQEVIVLHSVEGFSFDEIAAVTRKSAGSLRILKYRALLKLRNILNNENT